MTRTGPIRHLIRRLRRNERGALIPFFGVSLTVLLGMIALSFDLGRIAATQSELQSYADSAALAAAGELDGLPDAITRATSAANSLISETQTYGNQGAAPTIASITFYPTLPGADTAGLTGATTAPGSARYVRIVVADSAVQLTFAAAFAALSGNAPIDNTVSAQAVAGYSQFACAITPMMFCLPNDPAFNATSARGRMINLRSGGGGSAQWGPGDFGFLDPAKALINDEGPCDGLTGGNLDRCLIAAEGPLTACFRQDGVDIEPGQKVGIEDAAINVRFDIYKATMNGKRNDANYRPAPNVVKGIVPAHGGMCIGNSEAVSPDTIALPRDGNLSPTNRYGNGTWNRAAYIATNHGGTDPVPAAGIPGTFPGSRYEMYRAEIAKAAGGNILTGRAETGRAQCASGASTDPERRVIVVAGIDCAANPVKGAATGVPVKEFYRIFLTEPAGQDGSSPPKLDIWGEVVGSASTSGAGGTVVFHDFVQLYR